jgi:hypothetical protein
MRRGRSRRALNSTVMCMNMGSMTKLSIVIVSPSKYSTICALNTSENKKRSQPPPNQTACAVVDSRCEILILK